jgi:hypothetical protein
MKKGAVIDKAGLYRYSLWRDWDMEKPKLRDVQQRIMKQPILQTVKDEESVG